MNLGDLILEPNELPDILVNNSDVLVLGEAYCDHRGIQPLQPLNFAKP